MQTRERILNAARQLAAARSPSAVTVSEVARVAGVSRQTVYRLVGDENRLKEVLENQTGEVSADTPERLLAAAGRVFARYGYAGASLDQVAAEAGLTKGAIYSRFESKSHLFLALAEHRFLHQCNRMFHMIGELGQAARPETAISAMVGMQLAGTQSDPDWSRLFLEFLCQGREPDLQTRLAGFHQTIFDAMSRLVAELQTQKVLAEDIDPFQVAVLTNAMGLGLMLEWLINPAWVEGSGLESGLARILWRGLAPQTRN